MEAGFHSAGYLEDASKQVHGKDGLQLLLQKSRTYGKSAFYQGGLAEVLSTTGSHYSWFVVHNYLE